MNDNSDKTETSKRWKWWTLVIVPILFTGIPAYIAVYQNKETSKDEKPGNISPDPRQPVDTHAIPDNREVKVVKTYKQPVKNDVITGIAQIPVEIINPPKSITIKCTDCEDLSTEPMVLEKSGIFKVSFSVKSLQDSAQLIEILFYDNEHYTGRKISISVFDPSGIEQIKF